MTDYVDPVWLEHAGFPSQAKRIRAKTTGLIAKLRAKYHEFDRDFIEQIESEGGAFMRQYGTDLESISADFVGAAHNRQALISIGDAMHEGHFTAGYEAMSLTYSDNRPTETYILGRVRDESDTLYHFVIGQLGISSAAVDARISAASEKQRQDAADVVLIDEYRAAKLAASYTRHRRFARIANTVVRDDVLAAWAIVLTIAIPLVVSLITGMWGLMAFALILWAPLGLMGQGLQMLVARASGYKGTLEYFPVPYEVPKPPPSTADVRRDKQGFKEATERHAAVLAAKAARWHAERYGLYTPDH